MTYTVGASTKNLRWVWISVKFSKHLANAITQEGIHLGFSDWCHRCINKIMDEVESQWSQPKGQSKFSVNVVTWEQGDVGLWNRILIVFFFFCSEHSKHFTLLSSFTYSHPFTQALFSSLFLWKCFLSKAMSLESLWMKLFCCHIIIMF